MARDGNIWATGWAVMVSISFMEPMPRYARIASHIEKHTSYGSHFRNFMVDLLENSQAEKALQEALINLRCCMPINVYINLLECLMLVRCLPSRVFLMAKSFLVGWFRCIHSILKLPRIEVVDSKLQDVADRINELFLDIDTTLEWIIISVVDSSSYVQPLMLKLVKMLILTSLRGARYGPQIPAQYIPVEFHEILLRERAEDNAFLNTPGVFEEAFVRVGDSLLTVVCPSEFLKSKELMSMFFPTLNNTHSTIFLDLEKSREELMRALFTTPHDQAPSDLQINWDVLKEVSKAISRPGGPALNTSPAVDRIKEELDKSICTLATALADEQFCAGKDVKAVHEANDDLKLLSSAFGPSPKGEDVMMSVMERLQNNRPKIDDFLSCCQEQPESSSSATKSNKGKGKKNNKNKGKKK